MKKIRKYFIFAFLLLVSLNSTVYAANESGSGGGNAGESGSGNSSQGGNTGACLDCRREHSAGFRVSVISDGKTIFTQQSIKRK